MHLLCTTSTQTNQGLAPLHVWASLIHIAQIFVLVSAVNGQILLSTATKHNAFSMPIRAPPTRALIIPNPFGVMLLTALQEVLDVVDAKDNRAGRSGWVVQRYIERPLLVRGRKFDIRLFVLLVADPSTRSWRRKSKPFPQNLSTSDSNDRVDGSGQPRKGGGAGNGVELPAGEESRERAEVAPANGSSTGAIRQPPSPLRAWCHQDAYVRTSSVRYSNDPSKVKDKVRTMRWHDWELPLLLFPSTRGYFPKSIPLASCRIEVIS